MEEDVLIPNIMIDDSPVDESVDWRNIDIGDNEDDDEELDETPEDVIETLGFDPKEIEELTEDGFKESEHPRGQPDNPGQFVKKGEGSTKSNGNKNEAVRERMEKNNILKNDLDEICSCFDHFDHVEIETSSNGKKMEKFHIGIQAKKEINGEEFEAECSFFIHPKYQEGEIDLIQLPNELQGKKIGTALLKKIENVMKKSGVKRIEIHADLSLGGYAWARNGFDFRNVDDLQRAKTAIQKLLSKKGIVLKGNDLDRFNNLKTAKEISEFTIKGAVFTKSEWGINKRGVPFGIRMHVGKAVLLGIVNDYQAVKEI